MSILSYVSFTEENAMAKLTLKLDISVRSNMPIVCISYTSILLLWMFLTAKTGNSAEQCRDLKFTATRALNGKRLVNHVIRVAEVKDKQFCTALCFMEDNCFSYNIRTKRESGKQKCELNNATDEGHENDLEDDINYVYRPVENACASNPCSDKATCQTGFTNRGYRCLCPKGFTGHDCKTDINECSAGTHTACDVNAECINTEGSYDCSCKPGYQGDGRSCEALPSSCRDIYETSLSRENKAYSLRVGTDNILVYCVLNDTGLGPCGKGGWTLVMKIDGSQPTFHFNSLLWSNTTAFNIVGGETGFDEHETKLPTYWNTPFFTICLGMKTPGEETTHFIALNQSAASLHSLIADQQYRSTSLGRDTWKSLLGSEGSLQSHCNREGFNVLSDQSHARARIGIIANNEDQCVSCDSRIGFGTAGKHDHSNTCGNEALYGTDNGDKHIKAMGYIFIQ